MKLSPLVISLLITMAVYLCVGCTENNPTDSRPNHTTFQKTLGSEYDDIGYGVVESEAGNFFLCGNSDQNANDNSDVMIIKTDRLGNSIWNKTYGTADNDYCYNFLDTGNHELVFAGYSYSSDSSNATAYITKIDTAGDVIWTRNLATSRSAHIRNVIRTRDGGFALFGPTPSLNERDVEVILIKTDSEGNEEWHRTYLSKILTFGFGFCETSNGDFVFCSYRKEPEEQTDTTLVPGYHRVNSMGETIWQHDKDYYDPVWECFGMISDNDGGVIITGAGNNSETGDINPFIMKLDETGEIIWYQGFNNLGFGAGMDVIKTSDNSLVITGYAFNGIPFLLKANSQGEEITRRTYYIENHSYGTRVTETIDDGYAIIGIAEEVNGSNFLFIKTDPDGWVY